MSTNASMDKHAAVAAMHCSDISWLGRWRQRSDINACETEGLVWVRGPHGPDWDLLPALQRYTEDGQGRLFPPQASVPVRRLPEGDWLPLVDFLRLQPASALLPGHTAAPMPWSLVPASTFRPHTLMILPWHDFAKWGLTISAIRLRGLHFALSDDNRVCLRGEPLPSLPGEYWAVENGIGTPAGWGFPPGFSAGLVAKAMQLAQGEICLIHPDGSAERLPEEAFVEASRSAIRASQPEEAGPISRSLD